MLTPLGHCRRRKIRCIPAPGDPQNRCSNCLRLKKECHFQPFYWQSEPYSTLRPRSTSVSSVSSSTSNSSISRITVSSNPTTIDEQLVYVQGQPLIKRPTNSGMRDLSDKPEGYQNEEQIATSGRSAEDHSSIAPPILVDTMRPGTSQAKSQEENLEDMNDFGGSQNITMTPNPSINHGRYQTRRNHSRPPQKQHKMISPAQLDNIVKARADPSYYGYNPENTTITTNSPTNYQRPHSYYTGVPMSIPTPSVYDNRSRRPTRPPIARSGFFIPPSPVGRMPTSYPMGLPANSFMSYALPHSDPYFVPEPPHSSDSAKRFNRRNSDPITRTSSAQAIKALSDGSTHFTFDDDRRNAIRRRDKEAEDYERMPPPSSPVAGQYHNKSLTGCCAERKVKVRMFIHWRRGNAKSCYPLVR